MSGLHSCREGENMAGDNDNDAEFYKRESKKMLDEIKDLKNLQFIYVYIKRTMKYEKDQGLRNALVLFLFVCNCVYQIF